MRAFLRRIGAFLDPAQIQLDTDDEQPVCNDCGEPAGEQVLTGWAVRGGKPVACFTWLCDEHAKEFKIEKEISRGQ